MDQWWVRVLSLLAIGCAATPPNEATGVADESVVVLTDPELVVEAERVRVPRAGHEHLLEIASGQVIVSELRGGLLRRVTAVDATDAEIVLWTEPAEIGDALIDLDLHQRLLGASGTGPEDEGSVGASREALDATAFRAEFGPSSVPVGTDVGLRIGGRLDFDPDLDFELRMRGRRVSRMRVRAAGDLQAALDMRIDVVANRQSIAYRHPMWRWERPFVQFIGPVPVVEVVELELGVGVAALIDGRVTIELAGRLDSTVALGAEWNGSWRDLGEQRFALSDTHASIAGEGRVSAVQFFLYARVGVKLYDIAGPYVEVRPYVLLERNEGWHFGRVGLSGKFEIEAAVPLINRDIGVWSTQLFDVALVFYEQPTSVAMMTPPPDPPPDPPPPPPGCEGIPSQGLCESAVVTRCVDGAPSRTDCAQTGQGCGFAADGSSTCTAGCGDVGADGACVGNSLRYCRADRLYVVDCAGTCGRPDESSPYYCL